MKKTLEEIEKQRSERDYRGVRRRQRATEEVKVGETETSLFRAQTCCKRKFGDVAYTIDVGVAPEFIPLSRPRTGPIYTAAENVSGMYHLSAFKSEVLKVPPEVENMFFSKDTKLGGAKAVTSLERGLTLEERVRDLFSLPLKATCADAVYDLGYAARVGEVGVEKALLHKKPRKQRIGPVVAVEVKVSESGSIHWSKDQRAHAIERQIAGFAVLKWGGLLWINDMADMKEYSEQGDIFKLLREAAAFVPEAAPQPALTMGGGGPRTPAGTRHAEAMLEEVVKPRKIARCPNCFMDLARVRNVPCQAGGDHSG